MDRFIVNFDLFGGLSFDGQSSLQSYWAPSLDNRERWSNLLCAGRENMRPSEVSPSISSTISPAERQRSHMDFMDSCFNKCNFHGSMQFNFYKQPPKY